jgi:hypothetical protein
MFGGWPEDPADVPLDLTDAWKGTGDLTKLVLYFNPGDGCIRGVKATYGLAEPSLLGTDSGMLPQELQLDTNERINQMQVKVGRWVIA